MSQRRVFTLGAKLGTPPAIGQTVKGQDFHICSDPACHRILIASSESIVALGLTIWSSPVGCSTGRPRGCTDFIKEPAPTMACVALKTGESTPSPWMPPPPATMFPHAPSFLDHAPGVPLPLQLRQRDARRRALGRRGADVPRPPRGEGLGGERLGGAGVGVGGVGVGAVLRALPAHCCCCGGRRRGARGPCGVLPPLSWRAGGRGVAGRGGGAARRGRGRNPSRALPAPLCGCGSPRRCARFLRRGYPPCRRRAGGRGRGRGVARWGCGLRSPARLGPPPGAARQGLLLGRRGRSPRPAQAPGSTARCRRRPPGAAQPAARPAPPPPPASAPRAPRGSPPPTPGRRGSGSGTGGGGGRYWG